MSSNKELRHVSATLHQRTPQCSTRCCRAAPTLVPRGHGASIQAKLHRSKARLARRHTSPDTKYRASITIGNVVLYRNASAPSFKGIYVASLLLAPFHTPSPHFLRVLPPPFLAPRAKIISAGRRSPRSQRTVVTAQRERPPPGAASGCPRPQPDASARGRLALPRSPSPPRGAGTVSFEEKDKIADSLKTP